MSFSKEEKAMWLEDWRKSGKKAWTYAKENGLVPQTFVSWTKREKKETTGFIEIQPKKEAVLQTSIILVEKGEMRIHVPLSAKAQELRLVFESLGAGI